MFEGIEKVVNSVHKICLLSQDDVTITKLIVREEDS